MSSILCGWSPPILAFSPQRPPHSGFEGPLGCHRPCTLSRSWRPIARAAPPVTSGSGHYSFEAGPARRDVQFPLRRGFWLFFPSTPRPAGQLRDAALAPGPGPAAPPAAAWGRASPSVTLRSSAQVHPSGVPARVCARVHCPAGRGRGLLSSSLAWRRLWGRGEERSGQPGGREEGACGGHSGARKGPGREQ